MMLRTLPRVAPILALSLITLHAAAQGGDADRSTDKPAAPDKSAATPADADDAEHADASARDAKPKPHELKAEPVVELPPPSSVAAPRTRIESGCPRTNFEDKTGWRLSLCGYAALNAMHDSTQSFGAGVNNAVVARRGTYAGDHDQMQFTAKDSRLTVDASAPPTHGIEAAGLIQLDFTGVMPSETTENDTYVFGTPRLRLAMMKLHTPVVDVIAGQYHDLFGWGGTGYFPSTLGFLGLPGEIYHRQPQFRLSKTLHTDAVDVDVAGAAVRPVQKASGIPDFEGGLRLAINHFTGANQQAYGQPSIGPASIGVSGIARRFEVAEFVRKPADPVQKVGWGFALDAVLPIIPRSSNDDRSNGLTVTGEFTTGTGISDLYTGLTGGALFPTISNDTASPVPPYYTPNIDSGIVTFDANGALHTINWQAVVVGLQYYLPIGGGRVWVSGSYTQTKSTNITVLTPIPNRGSVYFKSEYEDGNLFVAITDAVQLSASFQTVRQLFGDGVSARNNRIEFGSHFFF
ncbi:MAG TPA: hypothetical protein VNW92_25665 [Polyangiaceae bacterium]|jgi:hypothetical protein|nr:hypothetical protein [Polyangiaceae bacterium]